MTTAYHLLTERNEQLHKVEIYKMVATGTKPLYAAWVITSQAGEYYVYSLTSVASRAIKDFLLHGVDVDPETFHDDYWNAIRTPGNIRLRQLVAAERLLKTTMREVRLDGWHRLNLPNELLVLPVHTVLLNDNEAVPDVIPEAPTGTDVRTHNRYDDDLATFLHRFRNAALTGDEAEQLDQPGQAEQRLLKEQNENPVRGVRVPLGLPTKVPRLMGHAQNVGRETETLFQWTDKLNARFWKGWVNEVKNLQTGDSIFYPVTHFGKVGDLGQVKHVGGVYTSAAVAWNEIHKRERTKRRRGYQSASDVAEES